MQNNHSSHSAPGESVMEKKPFQKKEMRVRTIGDLKKLLEVVSDELEIGYVDFSGNDTVMIWQDENQRWVNID